MKEKGPEEIDACVTYQNQERSGWKEKRGSKNLNYQLYSECLGHEQ